jgi:hypothetical protein
MRWRPDALTALGFAPSVRELPPRRTTEPLTWLILIALPLQAFLGMLGQKTAESAYRRLQEAVRGLHLRFSGTAAALEPPEPPRPVVLEAPASGCASSWSTTCLKRDTGSSWLWTTCDSGSRATG